MPSACPFAAPHVVQWGGRVWTCTICNGHGSGDDMSEEPCASCGAQLSNEVATTTSRLLTTLGPEREKRLVETFGGTRPKVLCAVCFNQTAGVLNGAA